MDRARKSERALEGERDMLEIKVEERTRELNAAQIQKMDQLFRFAEFGQLASGLFHDLTNILNALSLQVERDSTQAGLEVFNMHKEIEHFTEAMRKQLGQEDVVERFSLAEGIDRAINLGTHQCKAEDLFSKCSFPYPYLKFIDAYTHPEV